MNVNGITALVKRLYKGKMDIVGTITSDGGRNYTIKDIRVTQNSVIIFENTGLVSGTILRKSKGQFTCRLSTTNTNINYIVIGKDI